MLILPEIDLKLFCSVRSPVNATLLSFVCLSDEKGSKAQNIHLSLSGQFQVSLRSVSRQGQVSPRSVSGLSKKTEPKILHLVIQYTIFNRAFPF